MFDIDIAASNVMNAACRQLEVMDLPVNIDNQILLIREWIENARCEARTPDDFELIQAARHAYDRLWCTTVGISY